VSSLTSLVCLSLDLDTLHRTHPPAGIPSRTRSLPLQPTALHLILRPRDDDKARILPVILISAKLLHDCVKTFLALCRDIVQDVFRLRLGLPAA